MSHNHNTIQIHLGTEIAKIRKEMKLTQKQLCEGICTQPTISMIEKGEIQPSLDILLAISFKLKKPMTYFINILLMSNHEYVQTLMLELDELIMKQQYEKVYSIVSEELYKQPQDNWFQIFLKWQHYLVGYFLKKIDIDEALQYLLSLVNTTDELLLNKYFLIDRINTTIAMLYTIRGDFNIALFYYDKVDVDNIHESPQLNHDIYRIKVIFNKTKTLYEMGNYEESVKLSKFGIEKSIKMENMSFLGNFYYYIGHCYEKMKVSKKQIKECYKNALFFFEIMNNTSYVEHIKNLKKDYI